MSQLDVKLSTAEEVYCQLCCQGVKVSKLRTHPIEEHSIVDLRCPFFGCPLEVKDFHQRAFSRINTHRRLYHSGRKLTQRESDNLDKQKCDARKKAELTYSECFPGVRKVVAAKQSTKIPSPCSAVMPRTSQKHNLPLERKTQWAHVLMKKPCESILPRVTYLDPSMTNGSTLSLVAVEKNPSLTSSSVPLSTRSENALHLAGSSCAVCHKFVPLGERWRHVEEEHTKVSLGCPYRSSPFEECRFGILNTLYREAYDEYIAHMENCHGGLNIAPHHPYGVIMDYTEQLQKNRSALSEDHRKCFSPSPTAEAQSMRRKRRRERFDDDEDKDGMPAASKIVRE